MDITKTYFRQVPNFEYVNRDPNESQIDNYTTVKNLFKRGKIRVDIFEKLNYFTKYNIEGNERPDQVALKFYNNESLDWVILLSNNILNIQSEWPLDQNSFDTYLLKKYKSYQEINSVRYYESVECKDSNGIIILPAGLNIDKNYSLTYYDSGLGAEKTLSNISVPVTNYDHELKLEELKRNIYILKPDYLTIVFNDIESIMKYKKGSTQYVDRTLKKADNILLYSN